MMPTQRRYTFSGNPAAERTVRLALDGIAAAIANTPVASQIGAVILGGGYGRGEGGSTPDGGLYNDLDFFVAAPESAGKAIDQALRPIAAEWHRRLGIDVDFCPSRPLSRFRRDAETLMIQELLAGHETIFGAESLLDAVPRISFDRLPWREGARLLLNRGTGLLLARQRLAQDGRTPADADFIRRNIHKAELGCGDALLLGSGRYRQTGTERSRELELARFRSRPERYYPEALKFKYHPGLAADLPLAAHWENGCELWSRSLREFAAIVSGQSEAATGREAAEQLLRHASHHGRGAAWRNFLLTLRYAATLPTRTPWLEHPRLKLLPTLAALLANDRPAQEAENAYLTLWQRFN